MKRMVVIAALVLLTASAANAQERATGAAVGAVSGAVVLGPVGALAGAVIGYTAGPAISRSWGARGHGARQPRRTASRASGPAYRESQAAMREPSGTPAARAAPASMAASNPPPTAPSTPPVQPLE